MWRENWSSHIQGLVLSARVRDAQVWVNGTYRDVPGYISCAENGEADPRTMGSLIRALQHELGISQLADTFGPITLDRLEKRGGVNRNDSGALVRLLQCGLVCKGYPVDQINGGFDQSTVESLATMMNDAGLGAFGTSIGPKTTKAVFTLDSYRVAPNGSDRVREIQRWLNGSGHLRRAGVFVLACDGIHSRDTHRTLIRFLQFDLGMSDEQATGTLNAATRQALRGRGIGPGATGDPVRFFSAALVLNGHGRFTDRFDAELTEAVRRFQRFAALADNGAGDYPTWAEALASNGDPERAVGACDGITTITPARAKALRDAGYTVIGRYLDEVPGGLSKKIKPGELATIFAHGMKVFPISQYHGGHRDYFTAEQGRQDGRRAHDAAVGHGFNPGTVLYFAVDYDASARDVETHVIPYFRGVVESLSAEGGRYAHGVYGSRYVCARVSDQTNAEYSFVAGMSSGYTGNVGHPLPSNWAFNQITGTSIDTPEGPLSIDKNVHRPGSDTAVDSVNDQDHDPESFVAYLDQLFTAAQAHSRGNPNQLVLDALRGHSPSAIGVDREFLAKIRASGIRRIHVYRDPAYGVGVRTTRFAVICHEFALRGQARGGEVNRADLTGWGADLLLAYSRWRQQPDRHRTGYAFCVDTLGRNDGLSPRELLEDTDGYNVGMRLREGANIVDEVRANLIQRRARTRVSRMYGGRFNANTATTTELSLALLTGTDDPAIRGERESLIRAAGGSVPLPDTLPGTHLDEFCRGFAEVLHRLATAEITSATRPG